MWDLMFNMLYVLLCCFFYLFFILFLTGSHNWLITSLSHSAACVAPMEPKCPSLYYPVNTCFVFCLNNMTYCMESHIYLYIFHVLSPPPTLLSTFCPLSSSPLSLSLSLYLCIPISLPVAQSLLVPGKSPSKYGRRGSAIGIGTVEEVHV